MKNDNDKMEILKKFMLNINDLEQLDKYINNVNIFSILKTGKTEIRHSNILAWLLNPNENHGLKEKFLKNFILECVKKNGYAIDKWAFLDYDNVSINREWYSQGNNKYLDIVIKFDKDENKKIIAIENKIDSKESENQTKIYSEILTKAYPDYEKMLIFLTPYGSEPEDKEWGVLTYREIQNILKNINKDTLNEKVKLVLEDYIELLGREIMENNELIDLCNKIYKENKDALDLIFENKIDNSTFVADYLKECLRELSDTNENIIYKEEFDSGFTYVRFATKFMDNLLGHAKLSNNVWNNNQRYLYEFNPRELKSKEDLSIFFTLTLDNCEEDQNIYNKFRKAFNNNKKWGKRAVNLYKKKFLEDAVTYVLENHKDPKCKEEIKKEILKYVEETENKIKAEL